MARHCPTTSAKDLPPPTAEQQQILVSEHLQAKAGILRVIAAAGSGKTTTLQLLAKLHAHRHVVYLVFNRSMQQEAQSRFRDTSVHSRTWDSAAHAYFRQHGPAEEPLVVLESAETWIQGEPSRRELWLVLEQFCLSEDAAVGEEHVPPEVQKKCRNIPGLLERAQEFWSSGDCLRELRVHAVIFKWCQLHLISDDARRFTELGAELLLCDEFQDMNPVQVSVFRHEAQRCLCIAVGDPGQMIYRFRGACDALQQLRGTALATFTLSESFRFGPSIARACNAALCLHVDDALPRFEYLPCLGRGREDEGCGVIPGNFPSDEVLVLLAGRSFTAVCKTNNQAVELLRDFLAKSSGHSIELLGEPLRAAVSEDVELQAKVGQAAGQAASATFCTVHQAKGRQWDIVVLGHGGNAKWKLDFSTWRLSHDAINMLYVAMTRAQQLLVLPEEVLALGPFQSPEPLLRALCGLGCGRLFCQVQKSDLDGIAAHGLRSAEGDGLVRLRGARAMSACSEDECVLELDVALLLEREGVLFQNLETGVAQLLDLQVLEEAQAVAWELQIPEPVQMKFVRRCYPALGDGPDLWSAESVARELRASRLLTDPQAVEAQGSGEWTVASESRAGLRYVVTFRGTWSCTCPDHTRRRAHCKHIRAIQALGRQSE